MPTSKVRMGTLDNTTSICDVRISSSFLSYLIIMGECPLRLKKRRLELTLMICRIVLVDSTRRGKVFHAVRSRIDTKY